MRKQTSLFAVVFMMGLCAAVSAQYAGWTIPAGGKEEKSPLKASPILLGRGKAVFNGHIQQPPFSNTYDMPAFGSKLTTDGVWTVAEYVKSLRKPR